MTRLSEQRQQCGRIGGDEYLLALERDDDQVGGEATTAGEPVRPTDNPAPRVGKW